MSDLLSTGKDLNRLRISRVRWTSIRVKTIRLVGQVSSMRMDGGNSPRTVYPVLGRRDLAGSRSMVCWSWGVYWVSGALYKLEQTWLGFGRVDEWDGADEEEDFWWYFDRQARKRSEEDGGPTGTTKGRTGTHRTEQRMRTLNSYCLIKKLPLLGD